MAASAHGNNSEFLKEAGYLDRFFLNIERFAYTHSIAVILVSLLIAGLSIWYTVENLTFKNNRGDLVAKKLAYVETYEKYRQEFEDFDGMMVVVADDDDQVGPVDGLRGSASEWDERQETQGQALQMAHAASVVRASTQFRRRLGFRTRSQRRTKLASSVDHP